MEIKDIRSVKHCILCKKHEYREGTGTVCSLSGQKEEIETDCANFAFRDDIEDFTQRLKDELLEQLHRKNPFELPEELVEHYLRTLYKREEGREPGEEERRTVARSLRNRLLLEGMRRKLGIEVTDEELERHRAERASELGVESGQVNLPSERMEELRREIEEEKIFDLLIEKAHLREEKV